MYRSSLLGLFVSYEENKVLCITAPGLGHHYIQLKDTQHNETLRNGLTSLLLC